MPTNLLKKYNALLELASLNEHQRTESLKGVFRRDIVDNANFKFHLKQIKPTTADGEDSMERLFRHLTTCITDKTTQHREFEMARYRFQTKTQLTIAKIDKILDTGCGSPVFFLVCD